MLTIAAQYAKRRIRLGGKLQLAGLALAALLVPGFDSLLWRISVANDPDQRSIAYGAAMQHRANVQHRSPFVYSTLAIPAFAVYDV